VGTDIERISKNRVGYRTDIEESSRAKSQSREQKKSRESGSHRRAKIRDGQIEWERTKAAKPRDAINKRDRGEDDDAQPGEEAAAKENSKQGGKEREDDEIKSTQKGDF